jgi:hypothetical protein
VLQDTIDENDPENQICRSSDLRFREIRDKKFKRELPNKGNDAITIGAMGLEGYLWTDALTEMASMSSWVDQE